MKFNVKEVGLYSVILVLIWWIWGYIYGSILNYGLGGFSIFNYANIKFILVIIALISVFWKYKYNWIVISLPFFLHGIWMVYLLLMYPRPTNIFDIILMILAIIYDIFVILYLYIKGIKKIESFAYEIIFAILIFILVVIEILYSFKII